MYHNILVAVDGSTTSDVALLEALKAAKDGAKLVVATVVENPLASYDGSYGIAYNYEEIHAAFVEQGKKILEKARSEADRLGNTQVETRLIDFGPMAGTDVAGAIERTATELHADLIVIGTHGRRGIRRLLLGSVAEQLVRQSSFPVLLIRHDEHKAKALS